mmetsp:Transcript_38174/g.82701  ORF Transcript_38174/g.82701 Transcript_38174/m.82701 type:complete len:419 (+) Transcript_38174:159-1415(+)
MRQRWCGVLLLCCWGWGRWLGWPRQRGKCASQYSFAQCLPRFFHLLCWEEEAAWRLSLLCRRRDNTTNPPTIQFTTSWRVSMWRQCNGLGIIPTSLLHPPLQQQQSITSRLHHIVSAVATTTATRARELAPDAELTAARLRASCYRGSMPVVCRGVATSTWTIASYVEAFPKHTSPCFLQGSKACPFQVEMSTSDYSDYMNNTADHEPLYLFDADPPCEVVHSSVVPAAFHDGDWLERLVQRHPRLGADTSVPRLSWERRWLVLGPRVSGSRFHVDPYNTAAWNACLEGSKLWVFSPPNRPPPGVFLLSNPGVRSLCEAPSALDWMWRAFVGGLVHSAGHDLTWTIQRQGDVVVVPHGWWHCVLNLERSLALTQNVVTDDNLPQATATLAETDPELAELLQKTVHADRCDDDSDDAER